MTPSYLRSTPLESPSSYCYLNPRGGDWTCGHIQMVIIQGQHPLLEEGEITNLNVLRHKAEDVWSHTIK